MFLPSISAQGLQEARRLYRRPCQERCLLCPFPIRCLHADFLRHPLDFPGPAGHLPCPASQFIRIGPFRGPAGGSFGPPGGIQKSPCIADQVIDGPHEFRQAADRPVVHVPSPVPTSRSVVTGVQSPLSPPSNPPSRWHSQHLPSAWMQSSQKASPQSRHHDVASSCVSQSGQLHFTPSPLPAVPIRASSPLTPRIAYAVPSPGTGWGGFDRPGPPRPARSHGPVQAPTTDSVTVSPWSSEGRNPGFPVTSATPVCGPPGPRFRATSAGADSVGPRHHPGRRACARTRREAAARPAGRQCPAPDRQLR